MQLCDITGLMEITWFHNHQLKKTVGLGLGFLKTSNVMFHIFGLFDLWRVGMSNVPLFGCQRYAGI